MPHWTDQDLRMFLARQKLASKERPYVEQPAEREVGYGGLHDQAVGYLRQLGTACYFITSRTDMPTTAPIGTPDIIGWINGVPFAIELKRKGQKPRPSQLAMLKWAELAGGKTVVACSLEQVIEFITQLCQTSQRTSGQTP